MIKNIKYVSTTILLVTALSGCSTIESSYDSIRLNQYFGDDFSYRIEKLNTLEDNRNLLTRIENNSDVLMLLKNSSNVDSPNYHYYLDYKTLKNKIAELEFIEAQKAKIRSEQIDKEIQEEKEHVLQTHIEQQKLEEQEIKQALLLKEKAEQEEAKRKAALIQKEKEKKRKAALEAKKQNMHLFYLEHKKEIDKQMFLLEAHCNIEDSYMIKDDIEMIKSFVASLPNINDEIKDYVLLQYQSSFDDCLELVAENKILNPDVVEESVKKDNDTME